MTCTYTTIKLASSINPNYIAHCTFSRTPFLSRGAYDNCYNGNVVACNTTGNVTKMAQVSILLFSNETNVHRVDE